MAIQSQWQIWAMTLQRQVSTPLPSGHRILGGDASCAYDIDVIAMAPDVEERDGYRLMSGRDVLLDYTTGGQTSVVLPSGAPARRSP